MNRTAPFPPQIEMPKGMQAIRLDSDQMLQELLTNLEQTRPAPRRSTRSKSSSRSIEMTKMMKRATRISRSLKLAKSK